ncbi:hypothetical protein KM043_018835, partial [Ampulex compressa]
MIDTGAEPNLVKLRELDGDVILDRGDIIHLSGITEELVPTIGSGLIHIYGIPVKIHAVPDSFPVPYGGILGAEFLSSTTKVNFADARIEWHDIHIPFSKPLITTIPARSNAPIVATIINPTISQGYVEEIDFGPGIYAGNALVANREGMAYMRAINTTDKDITIQNPSVSLVEFDIPDHAPHCSGAPATLGHAANPGMDDDALGKDSPSLQESHPVVEEPVVLSEPDRPTDSFATPLNVLTISNSTVGQTNQRLERTLELLRLDHLNPEEQDVVKRLVGENLDLFHLPTDKLDAGGQRPCAGNFGAVGGPNLTKSTHLTSTWGPLELCFASLINNNVYGAEGVGSLSTGPVSGGRAGPAGSSSYDRETFVMEDQATTSKNTTGTYMQYDYLSKNRYAGYKRRTDVNHSTSPKFNVPTSKKRKGNKELLIEVDEYREVANIKKIREGILVEVLNEKQSLCLLGTKKFAEFDVDVSMHHTLNYCKGVISCTDLLNCSIEEIENELKDQGIVKAKRMTTRRNGIVQDTASILLTFERPNLPDKVRAAMYSLPVRAYIPPPLRCFRCQKFGHTSLRCKAEPTCACGNIPHEGRPCIDPIICIHCQGRHSAASRNCPRYKEEADIQKIKVEKKLNYFEAKREYQKIKGYSFTTTFADVVARPPRTHTVTETNDIVNSLIPKLVNAMEQYYNRILTPSSLKRKEVDNVQSKVHRIEDNVPETSKKLEIERKQQNIHLTKTTKANTTTLRQTEEHYPKIQSSLETQATMMNQPIKQTKTDRIDTEKRKENTKVQNNDSNENKCNSVSLQKILGELEVSSKMIVDSAEDTSESDENFFSRQ